MNIFGKLLSLFALTTVGMSSSANAQFLGGKSWAEYNAEAELACEAALQEDTIEALENYLQKYRYANTACRALARNALSGFSPSGFEGNGSSESIGYGQ